MAIDMHREKSTFKENGGGGNMNNNYVTHAELKLSEEQTQRKLDNLDNKITQVDNKLDYKFNKLDKKIDSKFNGLDNKIDRLNDKFDDKFNQIPMIIENALYKEREYQRNQQKENRRFFWGTIIIGGISAVAAIVSVVISLLH